MKLQDIHYVVQKAFMQNNRWIRLQMLCFNKGSILVLLKSPVVNFKVKSWNLGDFGTGAEPQSAKRHKVGCCKVGDIGVLETHLKDFYARIRHDHVTFL